ncbi:hypothetical protein [Beijerinckia mobilis]|uniref:hypothetical protein n=1 Tax=Beijerinckia mobilis TaxID=231434 RepID=UPI000A000D1B|nr:hypothetical protein [Beijerinckia mobilis]
MSDDTFGFNKSASLASKVASIKPKQAEPVNPTLSRIDEAAEKVGFHSREPGTRLLPRRKKSVGPTITINTRVPEDVAERFIQFCDQRRLSYWEGIDELMNLAKV